MAAILRFKMATKRTTTSHFPSALIISICIINLGFATILSSLRSSEVEIIGRNMLKMAAILKSKMAAKREMTSNFLSTFIAIHIIKNIGFATILSSLGSSEVEM